MAITKNMGVTEQYIRIIIGLALITISFMISTGIKWVTGIVGLSFIITGMVGY